MGFVCAHSANCHNSSDCASFCPDTRVGGVVPTTLPEATQEEIHANERLEGVRVWWYPFGGNPAWLFAMPMP